ncbi:hypothetical protein ALQ60_102126 [Pseudomonas syringae pv. papulans]|nr:hypothetical protein ALO65_102246 [Pseudomonas syringae pv. papulans]RMN38749.1 hypothetical protein ALQ60_102126 [Pseudomonas syringae pv. papulans]RMN61699.1 hypothetical protein ALQ56_102952 [Pseudomonas syringae pv. papulans]RMV40187.1 hypothetical protein ALP11_102608 [Pseudomonas syringae pv. papulans]
MAERTGLRGFAVGSRQIASKLAPTETALFRQIAQRIALAVGRMIGVPHASAVAHCSLVRML